VFFSGKPFQPSLIVVRSGELFKGSPVEQIPSLTHRRIATNPLTYFVFSSATKKKRFYGGETLALSG
jgi:hypothetical protein